MSDYITRSEAETEALGGALAQTLVHGDVVAYRGGLGAGKTAFTRGIAAGLGATDEVASPTFAIAHLYRGGRLLLAHFDMYRIPSPEALEGTGYYEFMAEGADPGTVYAVEWSENVEAALPDDAVTVSIERLDDNTRKITIKGGRQ